MMRPTGGPDKARRREQVPMALFANKTRSLVPGAFEKEPRAIINHTSPRSAQLDPIAALMNRRPLPAKTPTLTSESPDL